MLKIPFSNISVNMICNIGDSSIYEGNYDNVESFIRDCHYGTVKGHRSLNILQAQVIVGRKIVKPLNKEEILQHFNNSSVTTYRLKLTEFDSKKMLYKIRKTKKKYNIFKEEIIKNKIEGIYKEKFFSKKSIDEMVTKTIGCKNLEYLLNLELPNYKSILKSEVDKFSLISKENCSKAVKMGGINDTMEYLGSGGTYSDMHIEDSHLESFNLVRNNIYRNHECASKLWIFVFDLTALTTAITSFLQKNQTTSICPLEILHKDFFIHPDFLKKYNIKYTYLLQWPGDIVYIKCGIAHQVINLTTNFAEAINFASSTWNSFAPNVILCQCTNCCNSQVRKNPDFVTKSRSVKIKLHKCPKKKCLYSTLNVKYLKEHLAAAHQDFKPFSCDKCGKQYGHARTLKNHSCPSQLIGVKSFCNICDVAVTNFIRHEKTNKHNEKLKEIGENIGQKVIKIVPRSDNQCPRCQRKFTDVDSCHNHIEVCKGKNEECAHCGKIFVLKSSLQRHIKFKHDNVKS